MKRILNSIYAQCDFAFKIEVTDNLANFGKFDISKRYFIWKFSLPI